MGQTPTRRGGEGGIFSLSAGEEGEDLVFSLGTWVGGRGCLIIGIL